MLSERRKRSEWHNRRLGTIGRAAVSTYGQSALGSIISRDAPGGSSCNHAHITEEKTGFKVPRALLVIRMDCLMLGKSGTSEKERRSDKAIHFTIKKPRDTPW